MKTQTLGTELRFISLTATVAVLAAFVTLPKASADVVLGESSGTPLNVNVSSTTGIGIIAPTVSATANLVVQPVAPVSGSAPAPYSNSDGLPASVNAGAGVSLSTGAGLNLLAVSATTARISTGVLSNTATSNVNGTSGVKTTSATALVDGLDLSFGKINSTLVGLPLLNTDVIRITAGTITASAQVSGAGTGAPADDFIATYARSVEDLNINIFGVSILNAFGGQAFLDALALGDAVDVTVNLASLELNLPLQLGDVSLAGSIRVYNDGVALADEFTGDASATALKIDLTGINVSAEVLGGLSVLTVSDQLNASVSVATAEATQAIPEPSAALLFIAGAGLLVLRVSRRRCGRRARAGAE